MIGSRDSRWSATTWARTVDVAALAIALGAAAWHLTYRRLGPSMAADFDWAEAALSGRFDPALGMHYGHIWTLRVFMECVTDRRLAASLYGASASVCLLLVIYALGRRCGSRVVGLWAMLIGLAFPPLVQNFTSPVVFTPATAYGGAAVLLALSRCPSSRRQALIECGAGFLLMASLACDLSSVSALPVVLWLGLRERPKGSTLARLLGGAAVLWALLLLGHEQFGQGALEAFRGGTWHEAFNHIRGAPWPEMWRKKATNTPWIAAAFAAGTRETVLCAVGGFVFGFRHHRTLRVLLVWLGLGLPISAWLLSRRGETALVEASLIVLCPMLTVAAACLFGRALRSPAPQDDDLPRWLALTIAVIACSIAVTGIEAEGRMLFLDSDGFVTQRGATFLFTLAMPLCLVAACLLPYPRLRTVPLLCSALAMLLSGQRPARDYYRAAVPMTDAWSTLARVAMESKPKFALYHPEPVQQPLTAHTIRTHMAAVSRGPLPEIKMRIVPRQDHAMPDELLVMDYGQESKVARFTYMFAPKGYRQLRRLDWEGCMARVFVPPSMQPRLRHHMRP